MHALESKRFSSPKYAYPPTKNCSFSFSPFLVLSRRRREDRARQIRIVLKNCRVHQVNKCPSSYKTRGCSNKTSTDAYIQQNPKTKSSDESQSRSISRTPPTRCGRPPTRQWPLQHGPPIGDHHGAPLPRRAHFEANQLLLLLLLLLLLIFPHFNLCARHKRTHSSRVVFGGASNVQWCAFAPTTANNRASRECDGLRRAIRFASPLLSYFVRKYVFRWCWSSFHPSLQIVVDMVFHSSIFHNSGMPYL